MSNSEDQVQGSQRDPRIRFSDPRWVHAWLNGELEGFENSSGASTDTENEQPQVSADENEQPSGHVESFVDIDVAPLNPSGYEAQILYHYERAKPETERVPRVRAMESLRAAVLPMSTASLIAQSSSNSRSSDEPDAFIVGNPWSQRWSNTIMPPTMPVYDSGWDSARLSEQVSATGRQESERRRGRSDEASTTESEILETRGRDVETGMLTMRVSNYQQPRVSMSASQIRGTQSTHQEYSQPVAELPGDAPANVSVQQTSASRSYFGPLNDSNLERPLMAEFARRGHEPGSRTIHIRQFEDILRGLVRIFEKQDELAREERWLLQTLADVVDAELSAQIGEVREERQRMEERP